jgi:hypothetical protein
MKPLIKIPYASSAPVHTSNRSVSYHPGNLSGGIFSCVTLDKDQVARLQATIDRQKKELVKQRQKLAEHHDEDGK